MNKLKKFQHTISLALLVSLFVCVQAKADIITELNVKAVFMSFPHSLSMILITI